MSLRFNPYHSHRWAEHVKVWSYHLDQRDEHSTRQVYYNRNALPKDLQRAHFTPLGTALMYAIGMDQKMAAEVRALRQAFPAVASLQPQIATDTNTLMGLFLSDAAELLRRSPYSGWLAEIGRVPYNDLSLSGYKNRDEWRSLLEERPTASKIHHLIQQYIRARLAQEFFTLQGAVTTYHLIKERGYNVVGKAIRENAEAIAWIISGLLSDVIAQAKSAGIRDTQGMTTDHSITGGKPSLRMFFEPTQAPRVFNNCPIAEAYLVTDRVLGGNGDGVGFAHDHMDFCKVCECHGQQSVMLYLPPFLKVLSYERVGTPISAGGDSCDFVSTLMVGNGMERIESARLTMQSPPEIKVF